MVGMTRRDTVAWAKEEIMDAIDVMVAQKKESRGDDEIDRDEELELEKQRDRVAKFLGVPEKRKRGAVASDSRCGKIVAGWTAGVAPCRREISHLGKCVPIGAPDGAEGR